VATKLDWLVEAADLGLLVWEDERTEESYLYILLYDVDKIGERVQRSGDMLSQTDILREEDVVAGVRLFHPEAETDNFCYGSYEVSMAFVQEDLLGTGLGTFVYEVAMYQVGTIMADRVAVSVPAGRLWERFDANKRGRYKSVQLDNTLRPLTEPKFDDCPVFIRAPHLNRGFQLADARRGVIQEACEDMENNTRELLDFLEVDEHDKEEFAGFLARSAETLFTKAYGLVSEDDQRSAVPYKKSDAERGRPWSFEDG